MLFALFLDEFNKARACERPAALLGVAVSSVALWLCLRLLVPRASRTQMPCLRRHIFLFLRHISKKIVDASHSVCSFSSFPRLPRFSSLELHESMSDSIVTAQPIFLRHVVCPPRGSFFRILVHWQLSTESERVSWYL